MKHSCSHINRNTCTSTRYYLFFSSCDGNTLHLSTHTQPTHTHTWLTADDYVCHSCVSRSSSTSVFFSRQLWSSYLTSTWSAQSIPFITVSCWCYIRSGAMQTSILGLGCVTTTLMQSNCWLHPSFKMKDLAHSPHPACEVHILWSPSLEFQQCSISFCISVTM